MIQSRCYVMIACCFKWFSKNETAVLVKQLLSLNMRVEEICVDRVSDGNLKPEQGILLVSELKMVLL